MATLKEKQEALEVLNKMRKNHMELVNVIKFDSKNEKEQEEANIWKEQKMALDVSIVTLEDYISEALALIEANKQISAKESVDCNYCKKRIPLGKRCYIHETGNAYCSETCILTQGFYGNFRFRELTEDDIENING